MATPASSVDSTEKFDALVKRLTESPTPEEAVSPQDLGIAEVSQETIDALKEFLSRRASPRGLPNRVAKATAMQRIRKLHTSSPRHEDTAPTVEELYDAHDHDFLLTAAKRADGETAAVALASHIPTIDQIAEAQSFDETLAAAERANAEIDERIISIIDRACEDTVAQFAKKTDAQPASDPYALPEDFNPADYAVCLDDF